MSSEFELGIYVQKIISGGQIGADTAGLVAGKVCGIATGGAMPAGFKTKAGPRPFYSGLFGCHEADSENYPPRTRWNVINSDGTIRFAVDFNTAGEKLTKRFTDKYCKPCLDINLLSDKGSGHHVENIQAWCNVNNIRVLNVAGNGNYDIEAYVSHLLVWSFIKYSHLFMKNSDHEKRIRYDQLSKAADSLLAEIRELTQTC